MIESPAVIVESRPPLVLKSSFVPRHASKSYVKEQFLPSLPALTDQVDALPEGRERCARIQKLFPPSILFASQSPGLASLVIGKELERSRSSLSNRMRLVDPDASLRSTSSLSLASTLRSACSSPISPVLPASPTASPSAATFSSLRPVRPPPSRARRLPNARQPPRWERGEDAPWNPPTYLQQSRPGSQSHMLLESLPARPRAPAPAPSRWRVSAAPLLATALC